MANYAQHLKNTYRKQGAGLNDRDGVIMRSVVVLLLGFDL